MDASDQRKHEDLITHRSGSKPSANPFAQSANVTLSVPEEVEIRLVDASSLSDYEVWSLTTSILSSAVVGFLVAFFQAKSGEEGLYLAITLVFGLLMVISAFMAGSKRNKLAARSKKVRFRIGDPIEVQGD